MERKKINTKSPKWWNKQTSMTHVSSLRRVRVNDGSGASSSASSLSVLVVARAGGRVVRVFLVILEGS